MRLRYDILFNKVIIIEYIDKTVVGFSCSFSDFKKIEKELEKIGTIFKEPIFTDKETILNVEIKLKQNAKVSDVLKVLRKIQLLELGTDVSNMFHNF